MKKSLLLASLLAALFAGCSTTEVEPMGLNAPFPELESKTADGSGADLSGSGLDAEELAELQNSSVLSERSVYFDFDSYAIKAEFENVISAHAEFINRTGARIVLEGNASYEGSHEYNLALGNKRSVDGSPDGYYIEPTVFKGHNKMRIFQEEIFGPVVSVTTFKDEAEALEIANDTLYGLGSGVWTRNGNVAFRMGRGIKAGRVWTNCYHAYPAHAAFGGYKQSGIGRETHKMMLDHYQQTKNLLVSYSESKLGFF